VAAEVAAAILNDRRDRTRIGECTDCHVMILSPQKLEPSVVEDFVQNKVLVPKADQDLGNCPACRMIKILNIQYIRVSGVNS